MDDYLAFISLFWAFAFGILVGWAIGKIGAITQMLSEIKKEKEQ